MCPFSFGCALLDPTRSGAVRRSPHHCPYRRHRIGRPPEDSHVCPSTTGTLFALRRGVAAYSQQVHPVDAITFRSEWGGATAAVAIPAGTGSTRLARMRAIRSRDHPARCSTTRTAPRACGSGPESVAKAKASRGRSPGATGEVPAQPTLAPPWPPVPRVLSGPAAGWRRHCGSPRSGQCIVSGIASHSGAAPSSRAPMLNSRLGHTPSALIHTPSWHL